MSNAKSTDQEAKPIRWWLRFVFVPIGAVVLAAVLGYFLRPAVQSPAMPSPERRNLLAPGTVSLLAVELTSELEGMQSEVKAAMRRSDLSSALDLSGRLLEKYPTSPRGNYNRACVLSLLAKDTTDPSLRSRYLDWGESALRNALEYGFTNYLKLSLNEPHPVAWIQLDEDLSFLLVNRPGAKKLVEEFGSEDWPRLTGAGGGCVSSAMPLLLHDDQQVSVGGVSKGDRVASIDPGSGTRKIGVVEEIRRFSAPVVMVLNGTLVVTPSHPILTPAGWMPAGELAPGARMVLVSGQTELIRSVAIRHGKFQVVDISVSPWESFVVRGVVVHNKCMK